MGLLVKIQASDYNAAMKSELRLLLNADYRDIFPMAQDDDGPVTRRVPNPRVQRCYIDLPDYKDVYGTTKG